LPSHELRSAVFALTALSDVTCWTGPSMSYKAPLETVFVFVFVFVFPPSMGRRRDECKSYGQIPVELESQLNVRARVAL
jgi:hypothetical protein